MRRIAATTALLLTASSIAAATPAMAGDAPARTTTITMTVRGCDDCLIRPALLLIEADGKTDDYWGKQVAVKDGVAVITVPTDKTPGMSFLIQRGATAAPIDALPVIVTQYLGQPAGSAVTRAEAKAAKRASGCWLGTSSSSVTLNVRTTTVLMPTFPPDGTMTPVVTGWLVPTIRVPKGQSPSSFGPSIKGVLATQNGGWPCNAG